jgi:predicted RNA-binding Zn ribbon-like protein
VAGNAALDFANTALAADGDDPAGDVLASVDVFLAWCRHVGLELNPAGAGDGRAVLRELHRLRRAILAIALAIADGAEVPESAVEDLRGIHAEGLRRASARATPSLQWSWPDASPARHAEYLLADQAVELFRHGPLPRLKACDDCRFAFVDTTKNNSRRWCSMDDCGKDAKMARYIAKRAARTRAAVTNGVRHHL